MQEIFLIHNPNTCFLPLENYQLYVTLHYITLPSSTFEFMLLTVQIYWHYCFIIFVAVFYQYFILNLNKSCVGAAVCFNRTFALFYAKIKFSFILPLSFFFNLTLVAMKIPVICVVSFLLRCSINIFFQLNTSDWATAVVFDGICAC